MELSNVPTIVARLSMATIAGGGDAAVEDLLVILLVEDEELIRNVVEDTLDDGGFKVVLAESGEEAVKLLDASDPKYRARSSRI